MCQGFIDRVQNLTLTLKSLLTLWTQYPFIIHNVHVKFESDWTKTDQSVLHAQEEKYAYTHSTNHTQTIILHVHVLQGLFQGDRKLMGL